MSELRPCPFCGSDEVSNSIGHRGDGTPWPYVECENCGATTEPEWWNTRYDEWQPIETAPKDGTEIDLWCVDEKRNEQGRRPNCHWGEISEWGGINTFMGWIGLYEAYSYWSPTHWKPLPQPPKDK